MIRNSERSVSVINWTSIGFACFLAANSLLTPDAIYETTANQALAYALSLAQPLSFTIALFAGAIGFFIRPSLKQGRALFLCGPCMIAGWLLSNLGNLEVFEGAQESSLLYAYIAGASLLGIGMAAFFLLWQQCFSGESDEQGAADIIVGKGMPVIFISITAIVPHLAIRQIIALGYLCVAEICLALKTRSINYDEPLFADTPKDNARAYINVLALIWPNALCVGCIGFVSSLLRSLAFDSSATSFAVSYAALLGMLVAAIVMFALWQRHSFRFDAVSVFRKIYPALSLFLLAVPFFGKLYPEICYGINYTVFSFLVTVMMIQCAQISKRFGARPCVVYGAYAGLTHLLLFCGNVLGVIFRNVPIDGYFTRAMLFALVAMWALGAVLFAVKGKTDNEALLHRGAEFLALDRRSENDAAKSDGSSDKAQRWLGKQLPEGSYKDRLAKQCAFVAKRYYLTAREAEVMELLVRGNSVPDTARKLVVSESTVQTHCKNLYAKLGIHKRRDLIALVEESGLANEHAERGKGNSVAS